MKDGLSMVMKDLQVSGEERVLVISFLAPKIVTMRSPGKEPRSLIDTSQGFFNESAIGFVRWYDLKGVESTSLKNEISDRNLRSKFEEVSKEYSLDFCLR